MIVRIGQDDIASTAKLKASSSYFFLLPYLINLFARDVQLNLEMCAS
jgi:hypothetical protein